MNSEFPEENQSAQSDQAKLADQVLAQAYAEEQRTQHDATFIERSGESQFPLLTPKKNTLKAILQQGARTSESPLNKKLFSLISAGYNQMPETVRMNAEIAYQNPKATKAIAFAATETCGYLCCPDITTTINLVLSGWAARIAWEEWSDKKKKE